jgi:hypothetical protein
MKGEVVGGLSIYHRWHLNLTQPTVFIMLCPGLSYYIFPPPRRGHAMPMVMRKPKLLLFRGLSSGSSNELELELGWAE